MVVHSCVSTVNLHLMQIPSSVTILCGQPVGSFGRLGINNRIHQFDCSVFDGKYVTGGVDESYLRRLESTRNDDAKTADNSSDSEVIELHNQA